MKKIIPIFIVILLIVGAGAFYGGLKYGQSQKSAGRGFAMTGNFGPGGQQGPNGMNLSKNQNGGGFANGEIIAKDDKSITVKLNDGGSKIILYSAGTSVGKTIDGNAADLGVGQTIMANGKTNSDGSITATSIQIRPAAAAAPAQPDSAQPQPTQ
ncbi:MAG: hypothetical protein WC480_01705 [Patescibacteria group bacterium]